MRLTRRPILATCGAALFQTKLLVGRKPAWYRVKKARKRAHAASEAFTDVTFSLATFVGWGKNLRGTDPGGTGNYEATTPLFALGLNPARSGAWPRCGGNDAADVQRSIKLVTAR
jgi:hypothetical protein